MPPIPPSSIAFPFDLIGFKFSLNKALFWSRESFSLVGLGLGLGLGSGFRLFKGLRRKFLLDRVDLKSPWLLLLFLIFRLISSNGSLSSDGLMRAPFKKKKKKITKIMLKFDSFIKNNLRVYV